MKLKLFDTHNVINSSMILNLKVSLMYLNESTLLLATEYKAKEGNNNERVIREFHKSLLS